MIILWGFSREKTLQAFAEQVIRDYGKLIFW